MAAEGMPETPAGMNGSGGQYGQSESIATSWFLIALISFVNVCYTVSAVPEYCIEVTGLSVYAPQLKGIVCILAAASFFLLPQFFKRLGVFNNARRFRHLFALLSGAGIVSFILFALLGASPTEDSIYLLLILQLISTLIPAALAGCALHRAVKVISGKRAILFSGLSVIAAYALTIAHMLFILLVDAFTDTEMARVSQYGKGIATAAREAGDPGGQLGISFLVVYSAMLIIPVILLIKNKDPFEYTAPKVPVYFSEPLYRKFMMLAAVMAVLDAFGNSSWYSCGNFDSYSILFTFTLMVLPILCSCFIIFMLRKNKWMPVMLACVLALCFQQGLSLFFSDHGQLAIVYELMDTFSGSGTHIFLLFISLTYCIQRRKDARAAKGVVSLWLLANAVSNFLTPDPTSGISVVAAPAITFTVSIAATVWLIYLNGEHTRMYYRALMEEYRDRMKNGALSTGEAMTEAGLSEEEKKIALLLIEGSTSRDIARKLHMPAEKLKQYENAIRNKLGYDNDPLIAAVADEYKLTKRETDILKCLRSGFSTEKTAAELYIAEETVRSHTSNLMKKLEMDKRSSLMEWINARAEEGE